MLGREGQDSATARVGDWCPGAAQTTRSAEGQAKEWPSLGTGPAPGPAPPAHGLALSPSTGPHLPLAPLADVLSRSRAGAVWETPHWNAEGGRGSQPCLAGLISLHGPAPLPTRVAGKDKCG